MAVRPECPCHRISILGQRVECSARLLLAFRVGASVSQVGSFAFIIADAAAYDVDMRGFKLVEDGILIGHAGTHRIDHIHADDEILSVHRSGQEHENYQGSKKNANRILRFSLHVLA